MGTEMDNAGLPAASGAGADIACNAFQVPKRDAPDGEIDDAYATGEDANTSRFAVADGATQSSFSGVWALMLVRAYCEGRLHGTQRETVLFKACGDWYDKTRPQVSKPWALARHASGAYSTLVGLTIGRKPDTDELYWSSVAIGDSCLFLVKGDRLVATHPIHRADAFSSSPWLLSSTRAAPSEWRDHIRPRGMKRGRNLLPGDAFYLMTDALAAWFLRSHEGGSSPWREFDALAGEQFAFASWVDRLRDERAIRDDDVTLLVVRVTERGG